MYQFLNALVIRVKIQNILQRLHNALVHKLNSAGDVHCKAL